MTKEQQTKTFNWDNTYFNLPDYFYRKVLPAKPNSAKLVVYNENLAEDLGLKNVDKNDLKEWLSGKKIPEGSEPFAQAYAGHQFGHFTMLGDGRAILLGEHIAPENRRVDVQLKGGGQTPFSRRGDGKATIKSMLREYLFSEAMHYLNIPTSRSLAVVKTGEKVYRDDIAEGAVLTRIMPSHIRVGTFEFARYFHGKEAIEKLLDYTIERHFPFLKNEENKALALLEKVMDLQIDLVVNWMRVGFIHGVMNTDNVSIVGNTFDYGPCAFMNTYDANTVYSSIDTGGRYAFGNQPKILKWNLAQLAEALLPAIHTQEEKAIELAVEKINLFDEKFTNSWYAMMCAKIGIKEADKEDFDLVESLVKIMSQEQLDYTNTFNYLRMEEHFKDKFEHVLALQKWKENWLQRLKTKNYDMVQVFDLMKKTNPVFIPRNFYVEEALDKAVAGDFSMFDNVLLVMKNCYNFQKDNAELLFSNKEYDKTYQTFCGT